MQNRAEEEEEGGGKKRKKEKARRRGKGEARDKALMLDLLAPIKQQQSASPERIIS